MAIQGDDDRLAITAAAGSTPFSAYVQVVARFSDGTLSQGSGVMVGANDVLTVAHAIYSQDHGGWASQIQVTPGRYGDQKPLGVFDGSQISTPLEWQNSAAIGHDYGMISLDTDIGYVTGWVEYGHADTPADLVGYTLSTVGYPEDKGGNSQYFSQGTVDSTTTDTFRFEDDLDTMGGQSGSPVVYNSGGSDIVLGLVGHELSDHSQNIVVALSADSVEQIQTWAADNSTERTLNGLNPSFTGVNNATDLQIARMVELLFDQQLGYVVLETYRKIATEQGVEVAASTMLQGYSEFDEDSFVINQVISNTRLSGEAEVEAVSYLNSQLTAATTEAARGKAVLDAGSILAGLTDNAVFGSYAVAFNTEVTNSLAYSVVPMHSDARTVDAAVSGSVLQDTGWMLL
ncbi:MAG: trypsin-like serine protease [Gammaproteobacteria bacterium]|nr:trypsin-like serine protease [Gammaproteobacteria bacterium]MBT3966766.1 trypsin-like serine protease [Gammaproteobacteria bacterium]MBT4132252.1 trypsin-like serine protease [Candidatus Neomarinimicrobiota bacterium]MBT6668925.1 trypsin-like serine protease [Gammaproteobacteria bacterium]MBT7082483.1 trypsin-like serine protease [Chloroflexota bacterium]